MTLLGIPEVAISTKVGGFDEAIEALDEIKEFFTSNKLMEKNSIYNINIPLEHKGIRITRMGERHFVDEFLPQGNDMYLATYKEIPIGSDDNSIDVNAIQLGYISVTPLVMNRTNMSVFEELKGFLVAQ